jgi:DTW domain-containing protein YfiP
MTFALARDSRPVSYDLDPVSNPAQAYPTWILMSHDRNPTPCPSCRLQGWLCVCAHAPRVTIRTPLVVVVHVHDLGRTSNTVRLLKLAIPAAGVLAHGVFPDPADPASHIPAGVTPLVLFPGLGAQPLSSELVAALPSPPALVVPDGNWRQAGRMVKRMPLLSGAVKVALPTRSFEGRPVRLNQTANRMSTYEAVVQAVALLEGEEVAEPLLDFYRRATDRMLLARGKLRLGDVYGGLGGPQPVTGFTS